jgi:flagellar motor switch protein FliM
VGDIIQLDRDATTSLEVLIEDVAKFRCVPGVLKGQRAVRITEVLPTQR